MQNQDNTNKFEFFQGELRKLLKHRDAHEGSYKAFELEEAFLHGIHMANPELALQIPLLTICPMSNRSILEFNNTSGH